MVSSINRRFKYYVYGCYAVVVYVHNGWICWANLHTLIYLAAWLRTLIVSAHQETIDEQRLAQLSERHSSIRLSNFYTILHSHLQGELPGSRKVIKWIHFRQGGAHIREASKLKHRKDDPIWELIKFYIQIVLGDIISTVWIIASICLTCSYSSTLERSATVKV